jgi:hypothetical protein
MHDEAGMAVIGNDLAAARARRGVLPSPLVMVQSVADLAGFADVLQRFAEPEEVHASVEVVARGESTKLLDGKDGRAHWRTPEKRPESGVLFSAEQALTVSQRRTILDVSRTEFDSDIRWLLEI